MLKEGQKHPVIAGNIGTVACGSTGCKENEVVVTELSSFQLLGVELFQPKIAGLILRPIYRLSWDEKEYGLAKANIFKTKQKMIIRPVINADDADVMALSAAYSKKVKKYCSQTTKEIAWCVQRDVARSFICKR